MQQASRSLMFSFDKKKMKWFAIDIEREEMEKENMDINQACGSGNTPLWYYREVRNKLKNTKFRTMAEVKDLLKEVLLFAESRERTSCESIEWQITKRQEAEKRLQEVNKETKMRLALDLVASHRNISQGIAAVAEASSGLTTTLTRILDK